jgi:hypothetical protein
MPEPRPAGVSILAGAAFLASAALSVALVYGIKSLATDLATEIREQSSSAVFVLLMLEFCLIALAWILAATGRDLWRLRKRGRALALFFLWVMGVVGVALAAGEPRGATLWLGALICTASIAAIVYLCLPNVRHRFGPQAVLPWTPTAPRPLLVVALTSLASAACIIAATSIRLLEGPELIQGLAAFSIFWLPYVFIPFRLRGEKIKSGLTLAIAMGSALFLPGIALLYHVHQWEEGWRLQGFLLLGLLMQPMLVVAALRVYKSLPSEPHDRRKAAVSYAYGVLVFGLFWAEALNGNFPGPIVYNEGQAMESMRSVYMSADYYSTNHQGFFPQTPAGATPEEKPECENDRPGMYHGDRRDGYIISYEVVAAGKPVAGCRVAASYIGTARPITYGKTGRRSFFVDQTRIIRSTSENRYATASDPELPAGSLPTL